MKKFIALILCFFTTIAFADNLSSQPLPADQAFVFSAQLTDSHTIAAHWKMPTGYYLYRDRFNFKVIEADQVSLGTPQWPTGIAKQDQILGKYDVYENEVTILIPITQAKTKPFTLEVNYQGCSASGFCYPPVTKQVRLEAYQLPATNTNSASSQPDYISKMFADKSLGATLIGFFIFGLLLSFTPCVLPMIPILSGIILGQKHKLTIRQAFYLSLTYVLSMAFTYACAGVFAGLLGNYLQSALQTPWIIGCFSLMFVLLALSLFGYYDLKLPAKWQNQLSHVSHRQKSGTYIGVAIMGILATLIISPCVSPPLIGALSYISSTGDVLLGGLALWCMGMGMGIPLLIIGTTEGRFIPRSGPWMHYIKSFFGVMLLAVAIDLLERILPNAITQSLWALLLISLAVFMGAFSPTPTINWFKFIKGLGIVFAIYGTLLLIGVGIGNSDPLQPLKGLTLTPATTTATASTHLPFKTVNSLTELDASLAQAKAQQKYVMVDFYADWCVSCKLLERTTFADATVAKALQSFMLLKVDLSKNDPASAEIAKHFNVIAPPTLLFFDHNGQELTPKRLVGEITISEFLGNLPS